MIREEIQFIVIMSLFAIGGYLILERKRIGMQGKVIIKMICLGVLYAFLVLIFMYILASL